MEIQLPGQWQPEHSEMYDGVPNSRRARDLSETTQPYRLDADARSILKAEQPKSILLRLPARTRGSEPKLVAVLRNGSSIEVFLIWTVPGITERDFYQTHVEIFRGPSGGRANFVHDFKLLGPQARLALFEPPDNRDHVTVLVDVMGGSYWGTTYVISPDRTAIQKVAEGSDYEFADLDRNGIYEFISWNRRPDEVHCKIGFFFTRYYPEVFVRSGWQFRKVWPPAEWSTPRDQRTPTGRERPLRAGPGPEVQVVGGFADLNGDGRTELICLQDRFQVRPEQALAIYRLSEGDFHLVARAPIRDGQLAYVLSGVEKSSRGPEITVFVTTRNRCETGGRDPESIATRRMRYAFRRGELKLVSDASRPISFQP
jgi:hypothetical protein